MRISDHYVSADSHVVEPADLWLTRMDTRFRDRAPRIASRPKGDFYIIDGVAPNPLGLEGAMLEQKLAGKVESPIGHRYHDTRPGAWDPQARLVDQDLDHVRAEVIYPGFFGLQFFTAPDAEYQRECIRIYNDWLSEFCAAAPDRLLGAGLLPMKGPIEWAIAEAERIVKKGLRSVLIPSEVPERPYASPEYAPLWAALQDLGVPVSTHIGTSTKEGLLPKTQRLGVLTGVLDMRFALARFTSDMICAGVPQAYPKLQFVLVESGIGWIAGTLTFMDHWWADHRHWMEPTLHESPSFYFHRQFWVTFEEDRAGLLTRELLNVEHLMWGADYPHTEGTFPRSRQQVEKVFAGMSETEVRNMVIDNASRLYGLPT